MLVLNSLPNVQMLNGRSTKDEDEEEEEENAEVEEYAEKVENNENEEIENHNMLNNENMNINNIDNNEISNKNNNHLYSQMEEIEEDKNYENNSNYISNDNNHDSNNNDLNNYYSYKTNKELEKTNGIKEKKMTRNINILDENEFNPKNDDNSDNINNIDNNNNDDDELLQPNTLLYDKIISDNSNKKIINKNLHQNNDSDKDNKKIEKESIFDINNNTDNNMNNSEKNENYIIDISNEELNLLKEDKYSGNSEFVSFLKEFCDMFIIDEDGNSYGNNLQTNYLNKLKSIEEKKGAFPNYYYFSLLQKKKMKIIKNIYGEILPYIVNKCPELNKNNFLVRLNNELFNTIMDSKDLMNTLHSHIESFNEKKNSENNLNDIIKEKDNKISTLERLKNNLLKNIEEDKSNYEKKLLNLEKENKIMTERILTKANSIVNSTIITDTMNTIPGSERGPTRSFNPNNINNSENKSKNKNNKFIFNNEILNTNFIKHYNPTSITRSPAKLTENTNTLENVNTINYYLNTYGNSNTNRQHFISLKTLKDFINELYLSKAQYDIKCVEYKLPKETLEEHMYTFLNKKYGLKNLIIEWAKNVIAGIKYYSKKDSTVLLFGKIMRNEQEEDARFIIQKVSESIEELLLYYIKRQNPLKLINEIKKIFEQKKKSELLEEEWKGIIFSIYEKEEASEIQKKIENFINKENERRKTEIFKNYKNSRLIKKNKYKNNTSSSNNYYLNTINSLNNIGNNNKSSNNNSIYINSLGNLNSKLSRAEKYNMLLYSEEKKILYTDFMKIVLDNHIRFRDKQLKNFVELFKSVDSDKDGIIGEEEFTELIQKMKIFKEEEIENKIIEYLEKIDPFDNQRFTFSECVTFFSNEVIKDNDINRNEKQISILEKVCFNGNSNENGYNKINNEKNKNISIMEPMIDSNNKMYMNNNSNNINDK